MMILGIDPKVDYAFKHVFGREATRPLLINVLTHVLDPASGHEIRDIELLNPFNPKETLDDKLSIPDIKARDQAGRQFNVEMQMLAFRYYEKRILYYWAKLHQQRLQQGQDYLELKPTLSISFLDHVLFGDVPDAHLCFRLLETEHRFSFTDDLEFHLLELPKFRKSAEELSSGLDLWLYFLRHAERMDTSVLSAALPQPPAPHALETVKSSAHEETVDTAAFLAALQQHPQEQPLVLRALEELQMLAQSDVERERYEARRKAQLDYNTGLKVARMEGREEGRAEGRVEGREAGRAEGEIGRIHLCERLLKRPLTPTELLASRSLEELIQQADDLQRQVLKNA